MVLRARSNVVALQRIRVSYNKYIKPVHKSQIISSRGLVKIACKKNGSGRIPTRSIVVE